MPGKKQSQCYLHIHFITLHSMRRLHVGHPAFPVFESTCTSTQPHQGRVIPGCRLFAMFRSKVRITRRGLRGLARMVNRGGSILRVFQILWSLVLTRLIVCFPDLTNWLRETPEMLSLFHLVLMLLPSAATGTATSLRSPLPEVLAGIPKIEGLCLLHPAGIARAIHVMLICVG